MNKLTRILVAGTATLAVAGGIGAGVAVADPTPSPSAPSAPSSAPSSAPAKEHGKHRQLAARALHGEFVVGAKKPHTVAVQRGEVTAASTTSITVKSADGFTASYVIGKDTKVRKDKKAAAATDLKTGDRVRVLAGKDGDTLTAKRIGDAGPK